MLDDLKYIHSRDASDALGVAEKQHQQLESKFDIPAIDGQISNIVLTGMGGSALAGLLSQSWPGHKLPFEIWRNYGVPAYVGPSTLLIASSHSGNTEETLSALDEAEKRQAIIAVITSGGVLADRAKAANYPLAMIPAGIQPRMTVFAGFKALLSILKAAKVLNEDYENELSSTAEFLKNSVNDWLPTVPKASNPAKMLAEDLAGKSLVVYGSSLTFPSAYKWKISFNESSKNVAWVNQYPEFNHNEFIGWSSHPIDKSYGVIDLRSSFDSPQIKKRFELSGKLLSGLRPAATVIEAKGDSLLQQLLWLINYGDFVSLYLALLNGVDPSPVDLVEKLKVELRK